MKVKEVSIKLFEDRGCLRLRVSLQEDGKFFGFIKPLVVRRGC